MEFWLRFNNGAESLQLPVNPENVSITSPHGFEDVTVSNLGEYTIIGSPQLKTFTISSHFPQDYNASYCAYRNLPSPWAAISTIERWQRSGKPVRFIVTGTPISIAVTIRNITYDERAGSPGDVYYTLEMREYVFLNIARKSDGKSSSASSAKGPEVTIAAARPSTKETPSSYTVKAGDSLWKIAARVYGDGDKWRTIYEKNKSVVGPNPNLIYPGQKLVIPSGNGGNQSSVVV